MQETYRGSQLVRGAAVSAISAIYGCALKDACEGLHARALGSFCRGKDATGDIDNMVIPGDNFADLCPRRLLAAMVAQLHEAGVLTGDIALPQHSDECDCAAQHNATFLGICYVPGARSSPWSAACKLQRMTATAGCLGRLDPSCQSRMSKLQPDAEDLAARQTVPCCLCCFANPVPAAGFPHVARRIDIKVYYARDRVLAVNHFSGTEEFNRALRYWCGWPPRHVQALAGRYLRGASYFHLSDKRFVACAAEAQGALAAPEPDSRSSGAPSLPGIRVSDEEGLQVGMVASALFICAVHACHGGGT
jgi:DNA polymerase beta palm